LYSVRYDAVPFVVLCVLWLVNLLYFFRRMCNRKPSVIVLPDDWRTQNTVIRNREDEEAGVNAHSQNHKKKKKGMEFVHIPHTELVKEYRYTVPLEGMEVYFSAVINPLFIIYIGLHVTMVLHGLDYKWTAAGCVLTVLSLLDGSSGGVGCAQLLAPCTTFSIPALTLVMDTYI
jgi:hypothetical protein